MKYDLSIIIPAYNEEARLAATLDRINDYLKGRDFTYEILVIDDGSTDGTVEVAERYAPVVRAIALPYNMGKGAAVRRGMLEAEGEIRVFSDADLSTPIHELSKIIAGISNGAQVCIGSRALDTSTIKVHQPFYREFMGKTFNRLVQLFVMKGIKDTQCGFKGFTSMAALLIFSRAKIDGFGFDVEALYIARKLGFTVSEVAVEWYNDKRSTVNPVKDSISMMLEILKIRKLHKRLEPPVKKFKKR